MKEVTWYFAGLLIGPVLIIAGIVVDSSWHATDHAAHLFGGGYLFWFLGLGVMLVASVRMFLAHIGLVRSASPGGRHRLKSIRTATFSLYIVITGAGLLLLGGFLDTSWHHAHRGELDVFSPLHPYHSLVLVGLVANVAAGVRLFAAQVELSVRVGEAQSSSPLATGITPAPSGSLTILFTDMESSTALRQWLGDEKAQELVRVHNAIVRDALEAYNGSEIKHTGDGIMASFTSTVSALESAIAIQRSVAAHVEAYPEAPLRVYIGMNAGEPIAEEGDLFGTSVDLAKRICDQCQPGEILVSDVVRQLVAGKEFLFSDRGETALRGFEDPVRLYEVRWREDG
ncbi:MAG: adenylate/guanylate cyclase domain-containing protein [Chloroflexi bacterium]|nr:adenylate/guanylate cyclase domain-containing protein [Chloroflexota bacterium]